MPVASNFIQSVGRQWWRQIVNFKGLPQKVPTQTKQLGVRVKDANRLLATKSSRTQLVVTLRSHLQRLLPKTELRSLTATLRKRSAWQLMAGMNTLGRPVSGSARRWSAYAFVFVGLASGTHTQTANQGYMDGLYQRFFGKPREEDNLIGQHLACIDDYELGSTIGKGCNGAVVEARLKTIDKESETSVCTTTDTSIDETASEISESSSIEVIDETESAMDSFEVINSNETTGDSIEVINSSENSIEVIQSEVMNELNDLLAEAMEGETTSGPSDNSSDKFSGPKEEDSFRLAVKMMYNYGVESNEQQILDAMKNEILLAERVVMREEAPWQYGHPWKKQRLKPHPNILQIQCAFVDQVPYVADSLEQYPASLPPRYNPDGCGRNMTLFLVMKKYPWTLNSYLQNRHLDLRESLMLQAQLLEGIAHLNRSHIAHRDIKSDNILLAHQDGGPQLVLGDFGCCLVSNWKENLRIPYVTEHVSKGGNAALLAPEIKTAQPGWFNVLDFRKSDVWAAGAVGYEIFGAHNPYYRRPRTRALDSTTYSDEQLPDIPDVPPVINAAIKLLLARNHHKRPDARTAATMFQLLLWAPETWFTQSEPPTKSHVAAWLRSLAVEVIYISRGGASYANASDMEYCLKSRLAMLDLKHVYNTVCLLSALQK